jgi:hypothetical protein
LLERLCESLIRLEKRKEVACEMGELRATRMVERTGSDRGVGEDEKRVESASS